MSKVFCVSEEESVAGDEGVSGFGGVPTRTEGADNCVCGKGEKGGVANVEETVITAGARKPYEVLKQSGIRLWGRGKQFKCTFSEAA
ncbi:uncharacterized protein MONOS_13913 [Monocercomonoides exilis]|uniref:uncharacterized protein n=1 Tax=Monocercomonoides exilis TaxID=2049356 RepID=UPI00355AB0C8|nr:hypothetical protein MONOS_13913 [Monocercomonoides exilis]|eukprot:MONOS_13913.1-p1 / transcript=MONOS_13913.1 / gene=MONOS_13913 / organism=Monocercomonoides_exilis_PA203 / gene_product=unspecified product / transcript_product=unspecified product / location=Mono_scaffold00903:8729-9388(-) / protein_length=87 / sequence_SO=supercontig / SO=protein_coding / is_pseudo=false